MKWSKQQLHDRIEEVIVDAYGDVEQLGSFACVIDEMLDQPVDKRNEYPAQRQVLQWTHHLNRL